MNKASGGEGVPVELFQILKDDFVKVHAYLIFLSFMSLHFSHFLQIDVETLHCLLIFSIISSKVLIKVCIYIYIYIYIYITIFYI